MLGGLERYTGKSFGLKGRPPLSSFPKGAYLLFFDNNHENYDFHENSSIIVAQILTQIIVNDMFLNF